MSFPLENCPVCGGSRRDKLCVTRDRHYGISGVFELFRCAGCSLVFLDPMLSEAELTQLYPQDYYSYQDNFQDDRRRQRIKEALGFRGHALEPRSPGPGRILDIGCGSGWFLSHMRNRGWETYGVEVNQQAAKVGRTKAGLNIFPGTLRGANFPSEFFDCIRLNHSFEHVSCPGETLDEIHRIMRPQGEVLIGVPNVASLNASVFRKYWWYLGAPIHPFGYSTRTLSRLLERHRFRVDEVVFNSDFTGILGSFQIWWNRGNGRKSSEGWLIQNPLMKLSCQYIAKLIDAFRMGDAIEITASKMAV
jgi:SAM-dependent methyltransferase